MTSFLVASLKHELLPLAHRLRREGQDVQVLVYKPKWEKAWSGSLDKVARHSDGTLSHEALKPQIEAAKQGDLIVLTTVRRIAELFKDARHLYGPGPEVQTGKHDPLMMGGFFDGEAVQAPHLLVADWGLWPGNAGPMVIGGITLVRISALPGFISGALQSATERMKSESFKGLFWMDVAEEPATGELRLQNLSCGWPWLATYAFFAELESFSETLIGKSPRILHKFVSMLPISIPPWPGEKRSQEEANQPIEGLTIQQQGKVCWLDVRVDQEAKQLLSAGLDGLLGVATGTSDSTPALARARALELAHKLQIPEKQARFDMGCLVDSVLSTLEDRYGFVV